MEKKTYIDRYVEWQGQKIPIYTDEAVEQVSVACKIAAEVLDFITPYVKEHVSTLQLDSLCHQFILDNGAIPAPLNYRGFPNATCISVNHVVCHGIPSDKILHSGDILNIDITVIKNGWYGDTSRMFIVGKPSVKAQRLVDVTYKCLEDSLKVIKDGAFLGDIGEVIETLAHKEGFSVVEDFCGHGIGDVFHQKPDVIHFGKSGTGVKLSKGMIFTVEPMINSGKKEVKVLQDGWTAVTRDKSLSAQFEHQIVVEENGCRILTLSPSGYTKPPYI